MVGFLEIDVRSLDLELTLYPSYVLSLLDKKGKSYFKIAGAKRGCLMVIKGDRLITDCGPEASQWSGSWFIEVLESNEPKGSVSWLLDLLREQYPKLGLAVDPQDPLHILIAVFLSQATSFHSNVLKWLKVVWSRTENPFEAIEVIGEIAKSFQLKRLSTTFDCISSAVRGNLCEIRRNLIKCKYCGPKVADAFLLFSLADTTSAPIDRHFTSMVRKLGIWPKYKLARKELCGIHACPECPERGNCLRWLASDSFGKLAGWVQTAFYLHEKLFCSGRKCRECSLKRECSSVSKI